MKRQIFWLTVFSTFAFGADTIYAWGYGDILEAALNAVKMTLSTDDYKGIFKLALLFSIIIAMISTMRFGIKSDLLSIPKIIIFSGLVSALFITSRIDVVVTDRTTNRSVLVEDVPWAVAKPMVWFSGIEKTIGEVMEGTFTIPNSLNYTNSGFLTPLGVMDTATKWRIRDPYLLMSVNNYIFDCVVPDINIGYKNIATLANSQTLWSDLGDANPALVTRIFSSTDTSGTLVTCTDAYTAISGQLTAYIDSDAMDALGKALGGYTAAQVSTILGSASNYLTGYTGTSSAFLLQSIMTTQFSDTYTNYAVANGIDGRAMSYGVGKGEQTAQANMIISGVLGNRYLPVIKGVLVVILAALTPILALLMLTPMFFKVTSGYLLTMIWLGLWHIGEIILNMVVMTKASSYLRTTTVDGVPTIVTKPIVDSSYIDYVNMASSMYWMIPTIAGIVVGGFSWMAFQSMTGGMTAKTARGEQAATEVGSGNASFGNINANNSSMNKHDYTRTNSIGMSESFLNTMIQRMGEDYRNMNTNLSRQNIRIGGRDYSGLLNAQQQGDTQVLPQGGTATDMKGNTFRAGRNAVLDQRGRPVTGDFELTDRQSNTSVSVKMAGGKVLEEESKLPEGATMKTNHQGNEDIRTVRSSDGSSFISWKMAPDGHHRVIAAKLPLAASTLAGMTGSRSTAEEKSKAFNRAVGALFSGGHVDSEKASTVAQAVYADAKGSGESRTQTEATSRNIVASSVESTAEGFTESGDRVFSGVHELKDTDTGSVKGGVELKLDSDNAILGKLTGWLTGLSAEVKGGYERIWADQEGFTVKTADGKMYRLDYTKDFRDTLNRNIAKSVADQSAVTGTETKTHTETDSSSEGKESGSSYSVTGTRQSGFNYAEALKESYTDLLFKQAAVTDQRALYDALEEIMYENKGLAPLKGEDGREMVYIDANNAQRPLMSVEAEVFKLVQNDKEEMDRLKEKLHQRAGIDETKIGSMGVDPSGAAGRDRVMQQGQAAMRDAARLEGQEIKSRDDIKDVDPREGMDKNIVNDMNMEFDRSAVRAQDSSRTKKEVYEAIKKDLDRGAPIDMENERMENPRFIYHENKETKNRDAKNSEFEEMAKRLREESFD